MVDLGSLAAWFAVDGHTPIALLPSPLVGGLQWPETSIELCGAVDRAALGRELEAVTRSAIGDAPCVAVAASGGLYSAALLSVVARVCASDGRRLIAVTVDLPSDAGGRPGRAVGQMLEAFGGRVEHLRPSLGGTVLEAPRWAATGPWVSRHPALRQTIRRAALRAGASVVLYGTGGSALFRACEADITPLRVGGFIRSSASRIFGDLSRPTAAALFATRHGSAPATDPSDVLTKPYAAAAARWRQDAIERVTREASERSLTWAQAEILLRRMCVRDPGAADGAMGETAPFLESDVLAAAIGVAGGDRFDPALPRLVRAHALMLGMLSERLRHASVFRASSHQHSIDRYWRTITVSDQELVASGLLRASWRRTPSAIAFAPLVWASELWLKAGSDGLALSVRRAKCQRSERRRSRITLAAWCRRRSS